MYKGKIEGGRDSPGGRGREGGYRWTQEGVDGKFGIKWTLAWTLGWIDGKFA